MSKPYDVTTKFLVETQPEAWPLYLGLPPGPARIISADLSTITSDADKVIRVGTALPYLLHLEFQASPDADLIRRVLQYNVLLNYRHKLPVFSVVILLRKVSHDTDFTGRFEQSWNNEPPYLQFAYRVVRVWEQSVEQALNGGLSTLPLAMLADVPQSELPNVIARMDARIRQEATPAQARDLWVSAFVLMGLKFEPAFSEQLLKGVRGMEESSTYQYILARGEARGEARGRIEELRSVILRIGSQRFGIPGAHIHSTMDNITALDRLEQMVDRLLQVESWEELLA